ncbi:MAG TPA: porphobilinogen synthase, partial [Nitrospira sp.]|nr:porphobilinogen synthase [Nitrospira sp.]
MGFPIHRLRRLRQQEPLRRMVRETHLSPADFIAPLFVTEGQGRREAIESMPGQCRLSIDLLVKEAVELRAVGIPAIILFGIPAYKDDRGSSGLD